MLIKLLILLIFGAILFNLGRGFFSLIKDPSSSRRTLDALTWRIGLSMLLFILLMVGIALGVIHPHAAAVG
jgi:hypothetical protein